MQLQVSCTLHFKGNKRYVTAILKNQELNNKELNIMYLNWTNKRSKDIECTNEKKNKQMF